jgi:hypothetical protein
MAVTFQHRTPLYFARRYCKLPRLLFAAFLFLFWNYLPEPPKSARNARMDRPTPEYNIADKPRFLHHSRFREHPDYEYETMIDDSLRKIEEKVLAESKGNIEANETIWQIMLGRNRKSTDRGSDSIAFEHENREWVYKGRFPSSTCCVDIFSAVNTNTTIVNNEHFGRLVHQGRVQ